MKKSSRKSRKKQFAPSSTYVKPKNLLLSKAVSEEDLKKSSVFMPERYLHEASSLKLMVEKVAISH